MGVTGGGRGVGSEWRGHGWGGDEQGGETGKGGAGAGGRRGRRGGGREARGLTAVDLSCLSRRHEHQPGGEPPGAEERRPRLLPKASALARTVDDEPGRAHRGAVGLELARPLGRRRLLVLVDPRRARCAPSPPAKLLRRGSGAARRGGCRRARHNRGSPRRAGVDAAARRSRYSCARGGRHRRAHDTVSSGHTGVAHPAVRRASWCSRLCATTLPWPQNACWASRPATR